MDVRPTDACIGLNDVWNSLQLHSALGRPRRDAASRNGLSHANRERSAEMAEHLFWAMVEHLGGAVARFVEGRRRGLLAVQGRFMWWTPRSSNWWPTAWTGPSTGGARRPPNAICGSNLQSFLPSFVIIDTAGEHDNKRGPGVVRRGSRAAKSSCLTRLTSTSGICADLDERGVFWVTRAKDNMAYEVVQPMPSPRTRSILRMKSSADATKPNKPRSRADCAGSWRWWKSMARNGRWCS